MQGILLRLPLSLPLPLDRRGRPRHRPGRRGKPRRRLRWRVYLSTIIGGWLADRVLGSERVLFYSAVIIMLGHIALAVVRGIAGVAIGLILVALGSGGLKASATAVGSLSAPDDPRRDAGFSLFYLGINLGAFLGPIDRPASGERRLPLGFRPGSGGNGGRPHPVHPRPHEPAATRIPGARPAAAGAVPADDRDRCRHGCAGSDRCPHGPDRPGQPRAADHRRGVAAAVSNFVVIISSRHVTDTERSRVFAFIPLFIASVAFWSLYQQQFTVVTIYSDQRLDRFIGGFETPVPWVQSINPVFIIVLSGVFAAIWTRLGHRQPATPLKFAAGTMTMGLALLLFPPFVGAAPNSTPLLALIGIVLVFTLAELLLPRSGSR